jgi:glycosyltransferase involved in cell wall biosynthesis
MRILVVSQYFWPESFIITDIVKTLMLQGHAIEVLTGKPNYPDGKIFDGYVAEGSETECFNEAILVHRVPIFARGKGDAISLFRNYCSFVFNGLKHFHKVVKGKSFDVIFVFAPSPITQVIPAIYLKLKMKTHLAVWVQDLWPESLKGTGFIRNPVLLAVVGVMVRCIYRFTDTLLIQSHAFHEPLARYACPKKIIYYPNSYLDSPHQSGAETQTTQAILDIMSKSFCLVFAGNLGSAQSLETLVHTAKKIQHLPEIKLIVIGSGSMEGWLNQEVTLNGLDNLVLVGRFLPVEMPRFFSQADGLLVTLKKEEVFAYTVPSKIQAYLAAGRPIVAALDGEGAKIVSDSGAGLSYPAEDHEGLAKGIEQLYKMSPSERDRLGASGRAYYLENFEMKKQCQRLVEILQTRITVTGKEEI